MSLLYIVNIATLSIERLSVVTRIVCLVIDIGKVSLYMGRSTSSPNAGSETVHCKAERQMVQGWARGKNVEKSTTNVDGVL